MKRVKNKRKLNFKLVLMIVLISGLAALAGFTPSTGEIIINRNLDYNGPWGKDATSFTCIDADEKLNIEDYATSNISLSSIATDFVYINSYISLTYKEGGKTKSLILNDSCMYKDYSDNPTTSPTYMVEYYCDSKTNKPTYTVFDCIYGDCTEPGRCRVKGEIKYDSKGQIRTNAGAIAFGSSINYTSCTDSDSGKTYNKRGVLRLKYASGKRIISKTIADSCSRGYVKEGFCDAYGQPSYITYKCVNGCIFGRCI